MHYEWKTFEEVVWAMAGGGSLFVLQVMSDLDIEAVITDPVAWGIVALGGLARSMGAAGLLVLRKVLGR